MQVYGNGNASFLAGILQRHSFSSLAIRLLHQWTCLTLNLASLILKMDKAAVRCQKKNLSLKEDWQNAYNLSDHFAEQTGDSHGSLCQIVVNAPSLQNWLVIYTTYTPLKPICYDSKMYMCGIGGGVTGPFYSFLIPILPHWGKKNLLSQIVTITCILIVSLKTGV